MMLLTTCTAPALAVGAQVPSALTRHDTAAVLGCWLVSDRRSQYECQHCQGLQTRPRPSPGRSHVSCPSILPPFRLYKSQHTLFGGHL